MRISLALAGIAALALAAPAPAATTILSENFESGLGAFTAFGQAGINTGAGYTPCCGATGSAANLANHFVAFGSNNLPSGYITTQPIDLVAGETYTLDLDYAALGVTGALDQINVTIGPFGFVLLPAGNDNLDTTFQHRTVSFTGDGSSAALLIESTGLLDIDAIIDNIVLTTTANLPGTAAVPEPSTWAMMLLGFGAIGFATRRRRISPQIPASS